jgi:adenylosuccinate synthase
MTTESIIVAGAGIGDEGKGTTVDYYSTIFLDSTVVRFGGGHQAGHNNVASDGRYHCCAQFGSGIFNRDTKTFLSRGMLVEPNAILVENEWLKKQGVTDALDRLAVDRQASVTTLFHKMVCAMKAIARGENSFMSAGFGVGEAVFDRQDGKGIVFGDIGKTGILRQKLEELAERHIKTARDLLEQYPSPEMREAYSYFLGRWKINEIISRYEEAAAKIRPVDGDKYLSALIFSGNKIIMEGAQGILLDPVIGFQPYVTKTGSDFKAAEEILDGQNQHSLIIKRVAVLRAYATRHGSGPFVTEDNTLAGRIPEQHNCFNERQGHFRYGWFDLVAGLYALDSAGKADFLSLTNLDRLTGLEEIKVCTMYEYFGKADPQLLHEYFNWQRLRRRIIITAIRPDRKPADSLSDSSLSRLLFNCRPYRFRCFRGWQEDISKAKKLSDLPRQAREYVNFLKKNLSLPHGLLSVGPTAQQKIEF